MIQLFVSRCADARLMLQNVHAKRVILAWRHTPGISSLLHRSIPCDSTYNIACFVGDSLRGKNQPWLASVVGRIQDTRQSTSKWLCIFSINWDIVLNYKIPSYYSVVIMSVMASQITGVSIVLLNRLFRRRSKKTSKLRVAGLCEGNQGDRRIIIKHIGPVTRKAFPLMTSSWDPKNCVWHNRQLGTTANSDVLVLCQPPYLSGFNSSLPGSAFIKPDQPDPWIKDQLGKALLSTILPLQLQNFVSCGRDKPSHMTQNFVTVGEKLLTRKWFLLDP